MGKSANSSIERQSARFARLAVIICAGSLGLAACSKDEQLPPLRQPPEQPSGGQPTSQNSGPASANEGSGSAANGTGPSPQLARSTRSSLQWKRNAAVEADLSQALELPADELCKEFGTASCIRSVHLSPLGGHDPFTTGLLESPAEPQVTTSTVIERVVLSACIARREKDRALGTAGVVFGALDLDAPAPAPEDPATRAVIGGLYKRLLARDAEPSELDTLAALTRDDQGAPVSAGDFAALSCLAVGTSSEFLFF